MASTPRIFVQLFIIASAAVPVALAPVAVADPTGVPEAGSEPASTTIKNLRSQGYNVGINWVSGDADVPLSECSVTNIDTAAAPTVWVSVECAEAGD
ncbi:hypothetical protein [Mycobacterium sp. NPDC004974]